MRCAVRPARCCPRSFPASARCSWLEPDERLDVAAAVEGDAPAVAVVPRRPPATAVVDVLGRAHELLDVAPRHPPLEAAERLVGRSGRGSGGGGRRRLCRGERGLALLEL